MVCIHKSLHVHLLSWEPFSLYGLLADDADKRVLADNRQDEEEIVEVQGSVRVEG